MTPTSAASIHGNLDPIYIDNLPSVLPIGSMAEPNFGGLWGVG
jgi:hypothetical protein